MGDNIKKFIESFNEGLAAELEKQSDIKKKFKFARDEAIKITEVRSGVWPSDASIKTIGDLFGYVFPESGGIKKMPNVINFGGGVGPELEGFQKDLKGEENAKKLYDALDKSYAGFRYSMSKLKDKGAGQYWFDYFMYHAIEDFLKSESFISKVKSLKDISIPSIYYGLMTGDGSQTDHYSTFLVLDDIICQDSSYNGWYGLNRLITNNLATDDLLHKAFVDAGVGYSGPYTNDIKSSQKTLLEMLDIRLDTNPSTSGSSGSSVSPVSPDISVSPDTSGSSGSSGIAKFKPTFKGIEDGFQIEAKSDIPSFAIYVGDPDKDWPKVGVAEITENDDFENVDGAEELDEEYVETDFSGEQELFQSIMPNGGAEGLKFVDFKADIIVYDELDTSTSNSGDSGKLIGGSTKRANEKYAVPYGLTVTTVAQAKSSEYKALLEYADLGTEIYYSGTRIGNKQKLKNPDGILESVFMSELTFVKNLTWKDKNGTIYKGGSGTKFDKSWVKMSLQIHKAVRPGIEKAYKEIMNEYGLDKVFDLGLNTSAGSYYPRPMRGSTTPSLHSWGIAIDICAGENGLYDQCPNALFCKSDYKKFIDIMEANGWYSLGRSWGKDYMHFQTLKP